MSDTSGVDHLIAVLNENCGDTPPVVTRSAAGCTISVTFTPPELDFEWDLQFTCTVVKRGGCDVVVAIDFSAPTCIQKVQDLLVELRERVTPPFYIMTSDHARMFVKRTIYKDMEQEASPLLPKLNPKPLSPLNQSLNPSTALHDTHSHLPPGLERASNVGMSHNPEEQPRWRRRCGSSRRHSRFFGVH
jgi:hypothetical protein